MTTFTSASTRELQVDLLVGVAQIAAVLGQTEGATAHLIRRGLLPTGRLGSRVVASRRLLEQAIAGALTGVTIPDGDD